uniref:Hyperpolarization-activated cation channel protein n=1 Tax=Oryza sativa subsp. japonica TaxID=39947 RepID=Q8W2W6_ORYSJ|nr:putative hyperpolarization-activated cation channel protein [Oryza sativa Japonica Group]
MFALPLVAIVAKLLYIASRPLPRLHHRVAMEPWSSGRRTPEATGEGPRPRLRRLDDVLPGGVVDEGGSSGRDVVKLPLTAPSRRQASCSLLAGSLADGAAAPLRRALAAGPPAAAPPCAWQPRRASLRAGRGGRHASLPRAPADPPPRLPARARLHRLRRALARGSCPALPPPLVACAAATACNLAIAFGVEIGSSGQGLGICLFH